MDKTERQFWQDSGKFTTITGKFDIFILFLERAIDLLCPGGRLGFIVPYPFLSQNYAQLIRQRILERCCIESIYDLSLYKVFADASVSTCVVILRREPDEGKRARNIIQVSRATSDQQVDTRWTVPQATFATTFQYMFRLTSTTEATTLSQLIWQTSRPMSDFCYIGIGIDVHDSKSGADKSARIFDKPKGKRCKPYVEGKEIGRYARPRWSRYLDYVPAKMHRPKYPEMFEADKILVRKVAGREGIIATLDREHLLLNKP
jgi:hypothetical protein